MARWTASITCVPGEIVCTDPSDCEDDRECTTNLREAGDCVFEPLAAGVLCPQSEAGVCDAEGNCAECLSAGDCPDGGNECTDGTCQAGVCEPESSACLDCQLGNCQDFFGFDWVAGCYEDTIPAEAGPAAGTPKNQLCEAYVSCALTMPAELDGPVCGSEINAESSDAPTVAARWVNAGYAVGNANNLLRCIPASCTAECYP